MKRKTFGRLALVAMLVAALVVAAAVGVRMTADGESATAVSTREASLVEGAGGAPQPSWPLVVKLDDLTAARPEPIEGGRNPFGLQPAAGQSAIDAPQQAGTAPVKDATQPAAGSGSRSQTAPPIPLKFIGVVNAPDSAGKVAVLTDGRAVFQGREGDVIEGRYRILRIGVESVELEYVDGRGRQTIRLSG